MGKFSKALGDGLRDNLVGMVKYGPSTSYSHNRRAAQAARTERLARESTHKGGFGDAQHGFIDGSPVTFALGWGSKEGHTLLADGHVSLATFKQSSNHNHYGPGPGPNQNVKDRLKYSGPNA